MKTLLLAAVMLCALTGCQTRPTSTEPDPAQVARIAAMAEAVVSLGTQGVLAKNPEARRDLIAVAEAIEQAIAMPNAPEPSQLTGLITAAIAQFGGPYGALASLAVQGGLSFYRNFYAANTSSALDKQPAFKAVLHGLARGLRSGTVSVAAGSPVDDVDLVLKPRN